MLHELNAAARAFLEERHFAVLATDLAERPAAANGGLVLRGRRRDRVQQPARAGEEDANLRAIAALSLCIAEGYKYITIRGRPQVIADQATAQADIKRLAIRYHGPEKGTRMAEQGFSQQERVSYRVKLDNVAVYGFEE